MRYYFFAMLLLAIISYLGIVLYSFCPHDTSLFFYTSAKNDVSNYGGLHGARLSSLLFFLLGGSSYLIPFLLLFITYLILMERPLSKEWERLCAGIFLIIIGTFWLAEYSIDIPHGMQAGGLLGNYIRTVGSLFFSSTVRHISACLCTLIGFVIVTRLSFVRYVMFVTYKMMGGMVLLNRLIRVERVMQNIMHALVALCNRIRQLVPLGKRLHKTIDGASQIDELKQLFTGVYETSVPNNALDEESILERETNNTQSCVSYDAHQQQSVVLDSDTYVLPHIHADAAALSDNEQVCLKEREEQAGKLEEKLGQFGITGRVSAIQSGPVVTLFEYVPDSNIKISKILALEDDLALALQATAVRIIAPVPGKSVVGFEVANKTRKSVSLAYIMQTSNYAHRGEQLPLILGQDTIGNALIVDLATMPHLLIAGSTGSGKSVALNAMLVSLLCACSPEKLKLVLIDPKRLELSIYADIAHLLFPIITHPKQATNTLCWVLQEMESRYERMATIGVRHVSDYNKKIMLSEGDDATLPFIVVVIDELSDLILTAGRDVETAITRIAQMARAAGIHMIVATQRPSVDVITGLIKVNFPSRISFRVTSRADSRTILDTIGAERLLGKGDMLFLDSSNAVLQRVHGAYVSDDDIIDVVSQVKAASDVTYLEMPTEKDVQPDTYGFDADNDLYEKVLLFLQDIDTISISLLQRKFRIGYNRSARIIEMLEHQGHIMPPDGSKARKVIR